MSREVRELLEEAGYVLVRRTKHFIWKRGSDTITVSGSPRSGSNQLAWVRQEIARRDRARG